LKDRDTGTDATGKWGEKQAELFLRKKGYRLLGSRVRLDARDEIDIVARDGDSLVFVEVKTRASEAYGRPADAVNREKRRVLSRAAVRYLKKKKFPDVCFRFDVVEVVGSRHSGEVIIRHIENAFPLDRRYHLP
jgi:putative endonuclease